MEPISTTVIVTVAAVTGLIIELIRQASLIARDAIRAKYGKQVDALARRITPVINKNESLRLQISSALANHNSRLATSILMASPLSSAIEPLKESILRNEQGILDSEDYFNQQKTNSDQIENDIREYNNAFNSDLASATEAKHAWKGEKGDSLRKRSSKLEADHKALIEKLRAARKTNAVPSAPPASPNSGTNIGVLDRTGNNSHIPQNTMKGNN